MKADGGIQGPVHRQRDTFLLLFPPTTLVQLLSIPRRGTNIVLPVEAERSLAIFEWYLPEKDHTAPAAKASVEFSDQIQVEDVGICEIVQRNLHSRSYSRGRFSVKQEKGVHAFHRMYGQFMQQ